MVQAPEYTGIFLKAESVYRAHAVTGRTVHRTKRHGLPDTCCFVIDTREEVLAYQEREGGEETVGAPVRHAGNDEMGARCQRRLRW